MSPACRLAAARAGAQVPAPQGTHRGTPPAHLSQGQPGTSGIGWARWLVRWQAVRSHPGLVQEANKAIYKLSFLIAFGSIFQKQSDTSCLSLY